MSGYKIEGERFFSLNPLDKSLFVLYYLNELNVLVVVSNLNTGLSKSKRFDEALPFVLEQGICALAFVLVLLLLHTIQMPSTTHQKYASVQEASAPAPPVGVLPPASVPP